MQSPQKTNRVLFFVIAPLMALFAASWYASTGSMSENFTAEKRFAYADGANINSINTGGSKHLTQQTSERKVDCQTLNPFGAMPEECRPGIPSAEVAAQSSVMDEAKLIAGYTSQKAIAVLTVEPGAAPAAFNQHQACSQSSKLSEEQAKECAEISKVMPHVLLSLRVAADEGDAEAALLMAKNYLKRLPGAITAVRPEYLAIFDKYIQTGKSAFPTEAEQLIKQAADFRR